MSAPRQRFGEYMLLEPLGGGGMGSVWLAKREGFSGIDRLCVIKTLRADRANQSSLLKRFTDEARVVVRLHHRNICPVFDVGVVKDTPYMAMEHVVGVDLEEFAKGQQGKMPRSVALYIVTEILAALDYAHRLTDPATGTPLQIVHRDVSPHNVMVNFEGEVQLIDFGLARSTLRSDVTAENVVLGKLGYMSPEQARGERVDARSDQYAVGIILYELWTGAEAFEGLPEAQVWLRMAQGDWVPPRLGELPAALQAIVRRALAASPADRFPSCRDMAMALDALPERRDPGAARALATLMQAEFHDKQDALRALVARASGGLRTEVGFDEPTAPGTRRPPFVDVEARTQVKGAFFSGVPTTMSLAEQPTVVSAPLSAPLNAALNPESPTVRIVLAPVGSGTGPMPPVDSGTGPMPLASLAKTVIDTGPNRIAASGPGDDRPPHSDVVTGPQAVDAGGLAATAPYGVAMPGPATPFQTPVIEDNDDDIELALPRGPGRLLAAVALTAGLLAAAIWGLSQRSDGEGVDGGPAEATAPGAAPATATLPAVLPAVDTQPVVLPAIAVAPADAGPAVAVAVPPPMEPAPAAPSMRPDKPRRPRAPPVPVGANLKELLAYLETSCKARVKCATPLLAEKKRLPSLNADAMVALIERSEACARRCAATP